LAEASREEMLSFAPHLTSNLMEYYKTDYVQISYQESLQMALITWNIKFISQAQYQQAANALLALILDKHCTRCLCDTTHMGVMPLESQKWTNEVLTPKYMQSQLQYMAIVTSKDVFNKAAMSNIVRKANNTQFTTSFFGQPSEAMKWLTQQQIQPVAV
jgi:hypothetical protein